MKGAHKQMEASLKHFNDHRCLSQSEKSNCFMFPTDVGTATFRFYLQDLISMQIFFSLELKVIISVLSTGYYGASNQELITLELLYLGSLSEGFKFYVNFLQSRREVDLYVIYNVTSNNNVGTATFKSHV